jgi:hypothetical protein
MQGIHTHKKSSKVKHSQTHATNNSSIRAKHLQPILVSLEQRQNKCSLMIIPWEVEKSFKERSKALVGIFRNKWRHNHLLYQVFSKVF